MTGSAPRAKQAREVLNWCRHALQELQEQPTGNWIVKWAGTLALLRTVGEALTKVDVQTSPALCVAHKNWQQRVDRKNPIYNKFIQGEANRLLHQAEVRAGQSARVFFAMLQV